MVESINLFEAIINMSWFRNTSIILFLNKDDLFREKIARVDLGVFFPLYSAGPDYEHARKFVRDMFMERKHDSEKEVCS